VTAVIGGFGVTLLCYMYGGILVRPGLFLARLVAEDRGGESLMPTFLIINSALVAIGIYLILWTLTRKLTAVDGLS